MSGAHSTDERIPDDAVEIASAPTAMEIDEDPTTVEVRDLLAEHVPLALLADLALPQGPTSDVILDAEGLPTDPWWADPSAAQDED